MLNLWVLNCCIPMGIISTCFLPFSSLYFQPEIVEQYARLSNLLAQRSMTRKCIHSLYPSFSFNGTRRTINSGKQDMNFFSCYKFSCKLTFPWLCFYTFITILPSPLALLFGPVISRSIVSERSSGYSTKPLHVLWRIGPAGGVL